MIRKLAKYYHTIKYLKPQQIFWRVIRRFSKVNLDAVSGLTRRLQQQPFQLLQLYPQSMFKNHRFIFLNQSERTKQWNDSALPKLWLYNLHYFDDLNSHNADARLDAHCKMIDRWIDQNPAPLGNGWEPYPLSLRIVNWVKWLLRHQQMQHDQLTLSRSQSLALQAHVLCQTLEKHLLGNHLFANAKALLFVGLFLKGPAADRWLVIALKILNHEIDEQILSDGGNFELSPMYHAIMLGDLLDLVNIITAYQHADCKSLSNKCLMLLPKMFRWLAAMSHPDSKIALFNDAAFTIAPTLAQLSDYATALGIDAPPALDSFLHLADTGYIRANRDAAAVFLDVAKVGADYIPGHAHADTLSFELSLFGSRVVVNAGTSCYGLDAIRSYERSTRAHSTVEIDGENSSEVWSGFRVARRAVPFDLKINHSVNCDFVVCAHDGYKRLKGKPVHTRSWLLTDSSLVVADVVAGDFQQAIARYHFHPDVQVIFKKGDLHLELPDKRVIKLVIKSGRPEMELSFYSPEFGVRLETQCLALHLEGCKAEMEFLWR